MIVSDRLFSEMKHLARSSLIKKKLRYEKKQAENEGQCEGRGKSVLFKSQNDFLNLKNIWAHLWNWLFYKFNIAVRLSSYVIL